MDNKVLIELTHLQTGKPTFIDLTSFTGVRQNTDGKTLILTGDSGQYVKESVKDVLFTLKQAGYEIIGCTH